MYTGRRAQKQKQSATPLTQQFSQMFISEMSPDEQHLEWAMNLIDPASSCCGTCDGIPDGVSGPVVTFRFADEFTLAPPSDLPANTNWSAAFFQPSSASEYAYVFVFNTPAVSMNSSFWAAANAATYNDTTMTGGQYSTFVPNSILVSNALGVGARLSNYLRDARVMGHSMTLRLISSALTNNGVITSGQVESAVTWEVDSTINATSSTPPEMIAVATLPPYDADQLIQADPKGGRWNAYKGVYLPLKPMQPEISMEPCSEFSVGASSNAGGGFLMTTSNTGTGTVVRAAGQMSVSNNYMWGVTFVENLDPAAAISLKFIKHCEGLTRTTMANGSVSGDIGTSSWSLFTHSGPQANSWFREWVIRKTQTMPNVYEADANDLGDIWRWVRGAGRELAKWNIPFVSGIANAATTVFDAVGW